MDKYDIAGGLIGGLQQGLGTYLQTSEAAKERQEREKQRLRAEALQLAQLRAQGYDVTGEGADINIQKTPEMQERERRQMLRQEAGLLPVMDESGGLIRFDKPQDTSDLLDTQYKSAQISKIMADLQEKQNKLSESEEKKAASKETEKRKAGLITQELGRARNLVETNPLSSGRLFGRLKDVPLVGGVVPAQDLENILETVRANIGFDALQEMRKNSPTGGALGNVSDTETKILQATAGTLRPGMDTGLLLDNLKRLENQYNDIVHGPKGGPPRHKLSFDEQGMPIGLMGPQGARASQKPPPPGKVRVSNGQETFLLDASDTNGIQEAQAEGFQVQ